MTSTDTGPARRRRVPPPGDRLFVVGVTGGLGAGKSALVEELARSGAAVVSADAAGHAVLEEPAVREALRRAFGDGVCDAAGAVDRERLAAAAFATPEALARLNAISHPRLLERLRAELARLASEGHSGPVALEAALLVEWDLGPWCDFVVAVTAPPEARARRAAAARGIAVETARTRIARQLPDAERVRYADLALDNGGSEDAFRREAARFAEELWERWRRRASS